MVPVDSSAARMPRPGATMASATLFNSATFIALSRKTRSHLTGRELYPRPTPPSPRRGEGGMRGFGLLSKYSDVRTPHPVLLPSGEKDAARRTERRLRPYRFHTGDSAA